MQIGDVTGWCREPIEPDAGRGQCATGKAEVVVPLNDGSPTLGSLDPPHPPHDRRPRLDIAFGVNSDRWLVATVHDLLTHRELMREEPVVRLV